MKSPVAGRWLVVILAIAPTVVPAAGDGVAAPLHPPGHPPIAETAADSARLSDLPLAAQAQISAMLGRDQSSYHAARQAGGFRLENPKHGLAADFTRAGVRVRAGTASWGLSLLGYGYGGEPPATTAVAPQATANRVEYRRGDLTEWYLNGPLGLEQGFTLASAPGKSTGEPLTLAFKLSGNLIASAEATGKDATLSRADGRAALRYRGLMAQDATGRELRAWLQVEGERLWLRVDDTGAQYPVVVDPFIEQAKLTASDGAEGDRFGFVAVDGDTIVVGAHLDDVGANADQGSAYVFVKPAGGWSGPLTEQARLMASDGAAGDSFGLQVAMSGDTIVIGARWDDIGGRVDQGSAYVFVKPPGGWSATLTEHAKLTASVGAANDWFGDRVAISGDTVVVGARFDDSDTIVNRGSAYVFVRPTAGWSGNLTENATLNPSDGSSGDEFGVSVAISEETIAVGAWLTGSDVGSAYVFVTPAAGWSGNLTQNAKLAASDGAAFDRFGNSVAVSGDTVVVGALLEDHGAVDQGAAYVFEEPATGWSGTLTQNAKLTASDGAAGDQLGNPVSVSGDTVVAGARWDDIGANADQGSVYVFLKPATGWSGTLTQDEKLTASDGAASDLFGTSASVSGKTIVVGAPGLDTNPTIPGSAYVFVKESLPGTVTLSPADAENPVGTTHTVTATVEGVNGQAVADVVVRFDVTGSVTNSGSCTTDASGQCDFSYAGPTAPGSDTIGAFADTDGDGFHDPDEPGATATKTWIPAAPASVVLSPATAENPVGTSHTVTASVADAFANPVPGVTVRFVVTGTVSASGQCTTGVNGQCFVSYQGPTTPGADAIMAFADTDGDGAQDPGEPAGVATKNWVPGASATVTVTPEAATNPVGTEHCVDAAVTDSFGNAVPGVTVRFTVSGSVDANGTDATDASGQASFCYMGPELPGADAITAHADTDGDGALDAGEPTGGATKSWLLPESTPGQSSGGGHVAGPSGEVAFGFNAKNHQGTLDGSCNVIDRAAGVHVRCQGVTSFMVSGTHATVFGPATVNGVNTTYRIDVEDLGEPGQGEDVFAIVTQSGYEAGGVLMRGNIQVR